MSGAPFGPFNAGSWAFTGGNEPTGRTADFRLRMIGGNRFELLGLAEQHQLQNRTYLHVL